MHLKKKLQLVLLWATSFSASLSDSVLSGTSYESLFVVVDVDMSALMLIQVLLCIAFFLIQVLLLI